MNKAEWILADLTAWFGNSSDWKPTKRIVHRGRTFLVDILYRGGYSVQPEDMPMHCKKVWNLTAAAEAIAGWK